MASRFSFDGRFNLPQGGGYGETLNAGMRTGMALAEMRKQNRQQRTLADITRQATRTDESGNTFLDEAALVQAGAAAGVDMNEIARIVATNDAAKRAQEERQFSGVLRENIDPETGTIDYSGASRGAAQKGLTGRALELSNARMGMEREQADRALKERELAMKERYYGKLGDSRSAGGATSQALRIKLARNDERLEQGLITPEEHLRNEQAIIGAHARVGSGNPYAEANAKRAWYESRWPKALFGERTPGAPDINSEEVDKEWEEYKKTVGLGATPAATPAPLGGPSTPEGSIPPGLPPGTQALPDGMYRLPSGKIVKPKNQ
jgi:hypothetical protein